MGNVVKTRGGRRIGKLLPVLAVGAAAIAAVGLTPGTNAQSRAPAPAAGGERCAGNPNALGVSRVVELDPAGGPRYGHQNGGALDFLKEGEVVLTFDDGPLRVHTRQVLDALAAHCTKATFFMVGQQALADPDMVKEIDRRGHTVATHTWSHANLKRIGATKAKQEIEMGFSAVTKALGKPISSFFRFPYLAESQAMIAHLQGRNLAMFSIDVDAVDYRTPSGETVQRNIRVGLAQMRKGILLFHDIQPSTAQGIRGVLDELAKRGYKIVHIVSKTPAKTDPTFDVIAEKDSAARRAALAANPIANRAVTWTMGAPKPATPGPGQPVRPAAAPGQPAPVVVQPGAAPALQPAPQPAAAVQAEPAPKPTLRGSQDDDDWRRRVFQ